MEYDSKYEDVLNSYYENNAAKLRKMANKILQKFGGISDKDYHDFYSIANKVFVDVLGKFDGERSFDGFLYSCLQNKFKSEITARNRLKRISDRDCISLDTPVSDSGLTIGDTIQSDKDTFFDEKDMLSENAEKYLSTLNKTQKQIIIMKMNGTSAQEIKKRIGISDKQYSQYCDDLKSFEKIKYLNINIDYVKKENGQMKATQTMEKSKSDKLSVASIIKKTDKHTIRFDHPLQRESEQWNPSMKGNLISDILQDNPLPQLYFAEQIVNGIVVIWNLDGKQRCTNVYTFKKDGYRISKNIRRWLIEYQGAVIDENGNQVMDENGFPVYERKEFDIRGKRYSDLPEELQEKFNDYNFETVKYLNCSSEDVAYHIARYNDGKPMTAPQKGITRLGEEYASIVKSISNMPFFKDIGGYKVSEFKNGTINRVVVESIMAANYLNDWKKKQEDMCDYIRENATTSDFDNFEDMVSRLENVITDSTSSMFDSKDSFLWFGLFARFIKSSSDDDRFIEFMAEFTQSLHNKEINGVSYDELDGRSTKDKNIVIAKINHLETLMNEFLGINEDPAPVEDELTFIQNNVASDVLQEDIDLYNDCLSDYTLNVDNKSKLLEANNHLSLLAIMVYSAVENKDDYMNEWIVNYFDRNSDYIKNQKQNYLHMKQDFDLFVSEQEKQSA